MWMFKTNLKVDTDQITFRFLLHWYGYNYRVFSLPAASASVLEVEGGRGEDGDAQRDGEDQDGDAEDDEVGTAKLG